MAKEEQKEETLFRRIGKMIEAEHPGYGYVVMIMPNDEGVEGMFVSNLDVPSLALLSRKFVESISKQNFINPKNAPRA